MFFNATIECWFTLKPVRDMIITYNQMHRTDAYSQHSSIIWPVSLNGWVFVYKLRGSGFKSRCCHLNIEGFLLQVTRASGINQASTLPASKFLISFFANVLEITKIAWSLYWHLIKIIKQLYIHKHHWIPQSF